ncbi:MAG: hypothetical protein ACOCYR_08250 [Erythrobacter sp.]|uniref:hypothetical protein n=1 Tax=Erythrobacter sp. HL-111 TaxID=1798193 RepID=UPI0006DBA0AB|nr:hypothetical protein [Erythrobacter sp. HL-111]KPP85840.1 MAG: hypothetical protein HLUCCO15_13290 [Erythrobacteraceae bacterium HL-111]SDS79011.1 hypothetical protein SAMN04515621_2237 [Erythrobacter sp. HL-111]
MNRIIATAFAATAAFGLAACDVEQTEEGEMPEVEGMPTVEGGNMPEYDVDGPEVDVETEERTVEVPDVDVTTPEDDEVE